MDHADDRPKIVFFDLETTPPPTRVIVEFGAILICPKTLKELREAYSTLVRPADLSIIPHRCDRRRINRDALAGAPTFADIADKVYELLHGRIWAGHNVVDFDLVRIIEAFTEINRPPPEPKGFIDSLVSLTEPFGRRAGNMTLATLAEYFKLGEQIHRSIDDVRKNIEVIKHCATFLFLESSLLDASTLNSRNSAEATASDSNEICLPDEGSSHIIPQRHFFTFGPLRDDDTNQGTIQAQMFSSAAVSEAYTTIFAVLKLHEISVPRLTASPVRSDHDDLKIQLLHNGAPFQLCCDHLKIRFGINDRFHDHAGLPKLILVVDLHTSQTLCEILEACDGIAQSLYFDSGRNSDWGPLVAKSDGFFNHPTVRLRIPTAKCGNVAIYAAEIYQRDSSSGTKKRLFFDKFDVAELGSLFRPGTFVDAVFSFDSYDFQQKAGIRLMAKALTIHSN